MSAQIPVLSDAPAESNSPATATGIVLSLVMETPPHRELGFACRNEPTAEGVRGTFGQPGWDPAPPTRNRPEAGLFARTMVTAPILPAARPSVVPRVPGSTGSRPQAPRLRAAGGVIRRP